MRSILRNPLLIGLVMTCLADPAPAQDSSTLHTVSIGSGADVVVVLHGGPGFRHNYLRPEWDQLAALGRVVYYDQRGCGRSTREGPFGWRQHVQDLDQLLNAISPGSPVALAGSSWGAMLAVLFAHAHPGRVKALVLSGVPPWSELIERRRTEFARSSPDQRARLEKRAGRVAFDPALHTVRDSAWLVNESGAPPGDVLTSRLGDFCMLPSEITLSSLYDAPGLAELTSLRVATLIAMGDQPDLRGSGAEDLADVLPEARLIIVEGAGHDPWLERPEQFFSEVRQFLTSGR